jgi:hypothetical protein
MVKENILQSFHYLFELAAIRISMTSIRKIGYVLLHLRNAPAGTE